MTTTQIATRKPSKIIATRAGQTITATRLNPECKSLWGRRYAIAVDGERVGVITQTGRDMFTFPAMSGRNYLCSGLDEGMLYSAADSMTALRSIQVGDRVTAEGVSNMLSTDVGTVTEIAPDNQIHVRFDNRGLRIFHFDYMLRVVRP